jgi:hypothetical protein
MSDMDLKTFGKRSAKHALEVYTGILLMRMSREMGKKKMKELQQNSNNEPTPPPVSSSPLMEFEISEASIVRIMGVVSSFVETTLRNGLEVDPFLMKESQEILNGFQELLEIKQNYYRKVQNGNQTKR